MRDDSITVIVENRPYTVDSSQPNFFALRKAILDGKYDEIPNLVSIPHVVKNMTHGAIKIQDGKLYYNNFELHGVVVNKLFDLLKAGAADATPLLNFISRLMANPSANSVNELYSFLSYKSLPISPEGKFLAYKGVKNDFYSKQSNKDTIVVQGKTDSSGAIFNGVGETIEVARRSVDDNKGNHCSFGLHVGSYDYANDWAGSDGRLLLVEVDPADAVSVPTDCSFQKLRVSKYRVVSDITPERKEIPDAVYNGSDDGDEWPYDGFEFDKDDWDSDCCEDRCEDCDCGDDVANYDPFIVKLKIRNYIENRLKEDRPPTIKDIQSRMKDYRLSSEEIFDMCVELGFTYSPHEDNVPLSTLTILEKL